MKKKLQALRQLMKKSGLDGYLVPGSDPHQDEYVPTFWQRRQYISGFRGSAGDLAITLSNAGLWTDSRYFLQAEKELDGKDIKLFKSGTPGVPSTKEWLADELGRGKMVGVDPLVLSHQNYEDLQAYLKDRGIRLKGVQKNLVDAVWQDRPGKPRQPVDVHPLKYSGETAQKKLARIRNKMTQQTADLLVITSLDAIAWLFNIRGRDIKYNPVVIAYALISRNTAELFLDMDKLTDKTRRHLKNSAEIFPYSEFFPRLREIVRKNHGWRVWVDPNRVSRRVVNVLGRRAKIHFYPGPISLLKGVKNKTEIRGFRAAHIRDGVALTKFLYWLETSMGKDQITERSAAAKLTEIRSGGVLFRGPSFETISAYRDHSAIVHYGASQESDALLQKRDIYLIDSGAQYEDATTDITRTICLGRPRAEHKECFTEVLKGLISLTRTSFPQGTSGRQLDAIARLPLWKKGRNYGHGTGHGIGTYLNVHEGPHAISPHRGEGIALEPGMITTIEPGFYLDNQFGIRLENVVLVDKDEKLSKEGSVFFKFETLTLCPIDLKLIKKNMLQKEEAGWLNSYHRSVRKMLSPHLSDPEKNWLAKATRLI